VFELAAAESMPCNPRNKAPGVNGYMSAAPRSLYLGGVNVSYLGGHVTFMEYDGDDVVMAVSVSVSDN
jgi:prepilin-type processing-associated H-X9-DG protein